MSEEKIENIRNKLKELLEEKKMVEVKLTVIDVKIDEGVRKLNKLISPQNKHPKYKWMV